MPNDNGFPGGPAIGAGLGLVGSFIDSLFTNKRNRQARDFSREMYKKQKNDALDFWRMQNAYNRPSAQMQRFKDAGLNPNLIYGQGSPGQAGSIDVPSAGHYNPESVKLGSGISRAGLSYFDTSMKAAQVNNLGAQNDVLRQEALNKAADTANTAMRTARGKFDLGLARELRNTSLEAAKANVRKTQVDTAFQLSENERRTAMNAANLKLAAVNILRGRAEVARSKADRARIMADIGRIKADTTLKGLDINLKRAGVQPGDAAWMRILMQLVGFDKLKSIGSHVVDAFRK